VDIWRFLPYGKLTAIENMAIDEAVFRESQRHDSPPTLRFYGWETPCVSMGYFQDAVKEVDIDACRQYHYDVVRRPSGGKAVFHYNDLTYAVVAKTTYPPFTDDILGTYRVISQCIVNGLNKINIEAHMAEKTRPVSVDALETFCFSVPSRYELLVCGKKICGSAQVRSHGSFLQHGSLMMDFDPVKTQAVLLPHRDQARQIAVLAQYATSIMDQKQEAIDVSTICRALKEGFEETMHVCFVEGDLTTKEENFKNRLLTKYHNLQWNMEKSYNNTIRLTEQKNLDIYN